MSEHLTQRVRDLERVLANHFDLEQHRLVSEISEIAKRRAQSVDVLEHGRWTAEQDHQRRLVEADKQRQTKEAELDALLADRADVEKERDELAAFLNRKAGR